MAEIRDRFGLRIVTEAIDHDALEAGGRIRRRDPDWRAQHAELFAAESSGAQAEAGVAEARAAATLDEFLMAAEYIMSEGNTK